MPGTPVQDRTSRYTVRLGKELMSNLFSMERMTDIADLSLLKSRERDRLAEIFKYWSSSIPCDSKLLPVDYIQILCHPSTWGYAELERRQ